MGKDFDESTGFEYLWQTFQSSARRESPIVEKGRKIDSTFVVNGALHLLELNEEKGKMMLCQKDCGTRCFSSN